MIDDFNEILILEERDKHGKFDQFGANEFNMATQGFLELNNTEGCYYPWSNAFGPNHTKTTCLGTKLDGMMVGPPTQLALRQQESPCSALC